MSDEFKYLILSVHMIHKMLFYHFYIGSWKRRNDGRS